MQPMRCFIADSIYEGFRFVPGEMWVDEIFHFGKFILKPNPIILMIAEIDEQGNLVLLYQWNNVFNDGFEEFPLGACPAHCYKESARLFCFHAGNPISTVSFNVLNKFVIDMMACIKDSLGRGRIKNASFFIKATHGAKAIIT